jgi:acyl-coenzyme A synthetase/AMP-(fatty) acid ligase
LDEDGYLRITGRIGDVINRGGEKIRPREIEELLLTHPAVRDVAVVARPHPIYGQQPVAYVVPTRAGYPRLDATLRDFCAGRLSAYKVPAEFVEATYLPRTRTGKIQRHLVGIEPARYELAGTREWGMDAAKGAGPCD